MVVATRDADTLGEFSHPALFYRGDAEYLQHIVSFIQDGLDADEPVAVAVPGAKLRLLLTELGAAAERVKFLDMTRAGRNPGSIIPGLLHAFIDAHPDRRVRVVGEPIWPERSETEYPACVQHEALINLAFTGRAVTILCPYDTERLSAKVLADAEVTHPVLVDADGVRSSTRFAPGRIIADYNLPLVAPEHATKITFTVTNLVRARRFVIEEAVRLGLGGDHTDLELIVGELTANSIAHGDGTGTLSVWSEHGQLICEVRDSRHITDPLAGRRPADRSKLSGRGLLLANQLADLVRVHTTPTGTTVRLYLPLSPAAGARAPGVGAPGGGGQTRTSSGPGPGPEQTPLRWQTRDALGTAARFARYLPAHGTSSTAPDGRRRDVQTVLDALAASDLLLHIVDLWRARLVKLARERGARWAEIGQALGVSKQAAHERYGGGRRRPPADRDTSEIDSRLRAAIERSETPDSRPAEK